MNHIKAKNILKEDEIIKFNIDAGHPGKKNSIKT